jgi:hypothetical protein
MPKHLQITPRMETPCGPDRIGGTLLRRTCLTVRKHDHPVGLPGCNRRKCMLIWSGCDASLSNCCPVLYCVVYMEYIQAHRWVLPRDLILGQAVDTACTYVATRSSVSADIRVDFEIR